MRILDLKLRQSSKQANAEKVLQKLHRLQTEMLSTMFQEQLTARYMHDAAVMRSGADLMAN